MPSVLPQRHVEHYCIVRTLHLQPQPGNGYLELGATLRLAAFHLLLFKGLLDQSGHLKFRVKKSEKFNALEQHQTQLRLKNTGA